MHMTSGNGMDIAHIGNSILKTLKKNLHINNVLHVPHASKNLVSVHCFTLYSQVLIILYPYSFVVKDLAMRRVILRGKCDKRSLSTHVISFFIMSTNHLRQSGIVDGSSLVCS